MKRNTPSRPRDVSENVWWLLVEVMGWERAAKHCAFCAAKKKAIANITNNETVPGEAGSTVYWISK
jgi:hypothetical protein